MKIDKNKFSKLFLYIILIYFIYFKFFIWKFYKLKSHKFLINFNYIYLFF